MAIITISSNPALITSTDTVSTEMVFDASLDVLLGAVNLAFIEIVSGTFNFNVNGTASSSNGTYTDGDKFVLTFGNAKNISYKAANASETFKISF